jgi:endonuclease/exonuclease/phosphatase family metal-dependent hydrolase
MTFNIRQGRALDGENRWYRRRELVFEVIQAFDPHVLGAQEVNPNQLEELLDAFTHLGTVPGRRYGGIFGASAPILFDTRRLEPGRSGDFWLQSDPDGKRARGWDAAVPRICTWVELRDRELDRRFAVFNSHFDHKGKTAQVESARLVAERLAAMSDLPRLFLSDLNANESSEALRTLLEAGFVDTYRVIHPDEKPFFTYHRFRGTKSRGVLGKIDFILADDRWEVHDAGIVRTEFDSDGRRLEGDAQRNEKVRLPSDHYPVTATVSLVV